MQNTFFLRAQAAFFSTFALAASLPAAAADPVESFAMLSGYKVYYNFDAEGQRLDAAIQALQEKNAAALVYGSVGFTEKLAREPSPPANTPANENEYNLQLFRRIKEKGANAWLQLRVMDNSVCVDKSTGCPPSAFRNVTAAEILTNKAYRQAFTQKARSVIANYNSVFSESCRVILFEEETMYHSRLGGGYFWAGSEDAAHDIWGYADTHEPRLIKGNPITGTDYLVPDANFDLAFVDRFSRIYRLLAYQVMAVNPNCRIGIHIGHAPLFRFFSATELSQDFVERFGLRPAAHKIQPGVNTQYRNFMEIIPLDGSTRKPDFVMYDLYLKGSLTEAIFQEKLKGRIGQMKSDEPSVPVYYLAQIHTMNNFQFGVGRTLSKAQLRNTADLAYGLGVKGFGYYGKNAVYTLCYTDDSGNFLNNNTSGKPRTYCSREEDGDAFDPNLRGGPSMVFLSSPDRWYFGLGLFRP